MDRLSKTVTLSGLITAIEAAKLKVLKMNTHERSPELEVVLVDFAACLGLSIFDHAEQEANNG